MAPVIRPGPSFYRHQATMIHPFGSVSFCLTQRCEKGAGEGTSHRFLSSKALEDTYKIIDHLHAATLHREESNEALPPSTTAQRAA